MSRRVLKSSPARRPIAGLICVFLALVPAICTPALLATDGHEASGTGHHAGASPVSEHAHWSAAVVVDGPHHAHACCSVAVQKPTREDDFLPAGVIGTSVVAAQTTAAPTLDGASGWTNLGTPSGTPGLSATSAPQRC